MRQSTKTGFITTTRGLRKAVRDAKKTGYACVVLDGTLIPVDRVAADRPFYSGKHKRHGMNLQVIASLDGDILARRSARQGHPLRVIQIATSEHEPSGPMRAVAAPCSGGTVAGI